MTIPDVLVMVGSLGDPGRSVLRCRCADREEVGALFREYGAAYFEDRVLALTVEGPSCPRQVAVPARAIGCMSFDDMPDAVPVFDEHGEVVG